MEEKEKIDLAIKVIDKGWSYEELGWSDDLGRFSGDERQILMDEIWEYVEEYLEEGSRAFYEKYKSK